jgi:formylglycine-generating enzyme required for sulfatase activity
MAGAGGSGVLPPGYVRIPAGTFTMGSPESPAEPGRRSEETQHLVTITHAFLMKATEVTQQQWSEVMGASPSYNAACGPSCPVESVNWYEAIAFCNALSAREGLEPCYSDPADGTAYDSVDALQTRTPIWPRGLSCRGYRLPTEAEWEYAARATTITAFFTGTLTINSGCGTNPNPQPDPNLDRAGWYCANAELTTHPVALKEPNLWGLFDVHGNVSEWVWDWFGPGDLGPVSDPIGPASGLGRGHRGGAYYWFAQLARSANRNYAPPEGSPNPMNDWMVGVRPCRSLP